MQTPSPLVAKKETVRIQLKPKIEIPKEELSSYFISSHHMIAYETKYLFFCYENGEINQSTATLIQDSRCSP